MSDRAVNATIDPAAIARFLEPDGVALIGRVMKTMSPEQLLERERSRWGERFYFVNPSGGTVGDVPIYPSLADLPAPVQLAVISVGVNRVLDALDECAANGITDVVIFTGGFAEVGEEGVRLEAELAARVRQLGLTVLGPNTNTNAFEPMPPVPTKRTGKIGLVTQSGNQGRPFVQAAPYGVALSRWIATGNEIDLDVSDFIRYFAADRETAVVAAYVEGFQDGAKLRAALQVAHDARTPVVMLKMGQTEAGQRMARSHTGHLTGSDAVVGGLFAQYGVTRVHDVDELIETANVFSKLPGHVGDGVGVYGASGGMTTLLAENAQRHGLRVPVLTDATQQRLAAVLPDYLARSNPVDNGMQFLMQASLDDRIEVLRAIAEDPNIDVIVAGNNMAEGPVAEAFVEDLTTYASLELGVPIVCVWGTPAENAALFGRLIDAEIPIVRSGRAAMRSLEAVHEYGSRGERAWAQPVDRRPDVLALLDGRAGVLGQSTAYELLQLAGIPTCEEHLAMTADDAAAAWQAIAAPAVMKLASPDFPHRSDHGLVRLGITDAASAAAVHDELVDRARSLAPDATIDGVIVQRQVDDGIELLIGTTSDPVLGPAVTVGFGGVLAEVLADVAVRPVPLTRQDALEMLRSLRGAPILEGARGAAPADVDAVASVIEAVAALVASSDGRLAELDINPLIVTPTGAVAVDVLAIAAEAAEEPDARA
jgi:acyl-CoA synthetase (NDP forming)